MGTAEVDDKKTQARAPRVGFQTGRKHWAAPEPVTGTYYHPRVASLLTRRSLLLYGGALSLTACERTTAPDRAIDAAWHRQALVDGVLAHWLKGSPRPSGLFNLHFAHDWTPKLETPARLDLTAQGRMIYSMIIGYELTKNRAYLDAATRGTRFLLERFHDPVHGAFFHVVGEDGTVIADRKRTYAEAFALLALSHMGRVTGEQAYKSAALTAWQEISQGLLDTQGGFIEVTTRDFKPESTARTQNPVMHMFEALMALVGATDDPRARAAARALGDFVINQLMQGLADGSACIPEWYDEHWKPLPTRDKGGYIELGHQFEWVHLLIRGSQLGLSPVYAAVAERLLQYALKVGYDEIDGGAFDRTYPDGGMDRGKGYWQQCECLHALIAAASVDERRELWRRYEQTLTLVQKQFIDARTGGWYAKACRDGACMDQEQPEPYHMVSLHRAALQAAGAL